MYVARLNAVGITRFRAFLNQLREPDSSPELPEDILTSRTTAARLNFTIPIRDVPEIVSKMDMAEYLNELLSPLSYENALNTPGLWSWLGLCLFDIICPPDPNTAMRRVREHWYYVFQPDDGVPDYQTYYRHLLYTPYFLYRSFNGEVGMALLAGSASVGGDMTEQIASRQEYISCRPVLEALDHLYYDNNIERVKTGSTDRNRDGNVRRYVAFLQQIDATYDLYGMNSDKILELLPPEFDEWKS